MQGVWIMEIPELQGFSRADVNDIKAFMWLDRAIERHDPGLRHVIYSPFLDKMREDPRFDNFLVRIGLKPGP